MDNTKSDKANIQRLVEDVRHLILKVLGGHCEVKHEVKKHLHERERETNLEDSKASPSMSLLGRRFHRKRRRHWS